MHAEYHAKSSAKKWGGNPMDYIYIHNFLDQTKLWLPDRRHRLILHNTFGIHLVESNWRGPEVRIGDKVQIIPARLVAEQHILEDMGCIPTLETCMKELPFYSWLGGNINKKLLIKLQEMDNVNEVSSSQD